MNTDVGFVCPLPEIRSLGLLPSRTEVRAAAAEFECCRDATSIAGLRSLQRRFPEAWHIVLVAVLPRARLSRGSTLGEWLASGAGGLLFAPKAGFKGLRRLRNSAGHLCTALGDIPIAAIDEEHLHALRDDYCGLWEGARASESIGADMTLLRRAVHAGRQFLGLDLVEATWRARAARPPRSPRPPPHPLDVGGFLLVLGNLLRAVVVLAVGAGLLDGEVRRLRVRDLDLAPGREEVRVVHLGVRGVPGRLADRTLPLPPWAVVVLRTAFPDLEAQAPDDLLFPNARDRSRPCSSFTRALRAIAVQHGYCREGDPENLFGSSGLRRLFQAVAEACGVPRGLVRGTRLPGGNLGRGGRAAELGDHPGAQDGCGLGEPRASAWRLRPSVGPAAGAQGRRAVAARAEVSEARPGVEDPRRELEPSVRRMLEGGAGGGGTTSPWCWCLWGEMSRWALSDGCATGRNVGVCGEQGRSCWCLWGPWLLRGHGREGLDRVFLGCRRRMACSNIEQSKPIPPTALGRAVAQVEDPVERSTEDVSVEPEPEPEVERAPQVSLEQKKAALPSRGPSPPGRPLAPTRRRSNARSNWSPCSRPRAA